MSLTTAEEIEELQLLLEAKLLARDVDSLRKLALDLNISEQTWKDQSKMKVLQVLRKFLDVEDAIHNLFSEKIIVPNQK